jgi:ribonuclease P protein component
MKNIAIKEHHLYNKAYQKGTRYIGRCICVYILRDYASKRLMLENPQKKYVNRVGLTVSKKLGNAVIRNRTKRIIREGYSAVLRLTPIKTGYLIVIAARTEAIDKKTSEIEKELLTAFEYLKMFDNRGIQSADKTV